MERKLSPVDLIDVAAMRNSGWEVQEIADHFGVNRSTIYTYMREWEIDLHHGPRTHCQRNHEFTPENTRVYKDGRRECRECKRERDREWQRQRYWTKKSA